MIEREQRIRQYFDSWINKDSSMLSTIFDPNIVYTESYGPQYRGFDTLLLWFEDWNTHGTVLNWTIKHYFLQPIAKNPPGNCGSSYVREPAIHVQQKKASLSSS
ncbi:nuclear transport factor 2 family protein [Paenibacillus sp. FSL R7-0204]|uniref:nuclear transport factor 2 family protein n=1 Tax=Paenibacillus sp. FSL R7-0204 TaxID=2921675 RepID=UPI0030F68117